jgi:hypothetical protein
MPSAVITASSSGDNTIVSGQAGYAVRALYFLLTFSAAVNAQWFSDTGGSPVALTGLLYGIGTSPAPIDSGEVAPAGRGLFQTASGKALNLKLSGAVAVGGFIVYEMVAQ